ncbi:MAG: hypothetical protein MJE77_46170 [Proteobacteria bacterium]|nr:hypothetical protein [Pseudomonadota bacterium]
MSTSPLTEARLRVWQLGPDGERLERRPVVEVETDEFGQFAIDVGSGAYGALRFEVYGGQSQEYWSAERLGFDDSSQPARAARWEARGADRPLLSGVFYRVHERLEGYTVAITPWTTLAEELARARFRGFFPGDPEASYGNATERALQLLSEHLGLRDLMELDPAPLDEGAASLSPAVRYSLSLAALSTLARQMAERSTESVQAVNTMILTHALAEDVSGEGAIFDGVGEANNQLVIGTCIEPADCAGEQCEQLCNLGPHSLRTHLAGALVAFIQSDLNKTPLDTSDVLDMAVEIATNEESELFGEAVCELFDTDPPDITVLSSLIRDEQYDAIDFDEQAVPIHEPIGPQIDLGDSHTCPAVAKYAHRLDSIEHNPLRWRFMVDDGGVGFTPETVEYRVRLPEQSQTLLDWTPAHMLGSDVYGVTSAQYEIVLLRVQVPALATEQGVFELDIRATDRLENRSNVVTLCWAHTPLPAPLRVGAAHLSQGSGSLSAATLGEFNNLAPSINGAQELEVMEFDVHNGTDEVSYVTLEYLQSATYSKQWIKSNAELETDDNPAPDCATAPIDPCLDEPPLGYGTTGETVPALPVPAAAWGVRIWDVTFSDDGVELDSCLVRGDGDCEANEYRFEPRVSPNRPRHYRVVLTLRDTSFLAPAPAGQSGGYNDLPLDLDYYPQFIITGNRYSAWTWCSRHRQPGGDECEQTKIYRHFRALLSSHLEASFLEIIGSVATTPLLIPLSPRASGTFRDPVRLSSFSWNIREEATLPPTFP